MPWLSGQGSREVRSRAGYSPLAVPLLVGPAGQLLCGLLGLVGGVLRGVAVAGHSAIAAHDARPSRRLAGFSLRTQASTSSLWIFHLQPAAR